MISWISKLKNGGSKAFEVKPGRGRRFKLSLDQKNEIKYYILEKGSELSAKNYKFL